MYGNTEHKWRPKKTRRDTLRHRVQIETNEDTCRHADTHGDTKYRHANILRCLEKYKHRVQIKSREGT